MLGLCVWREAFIQEVHPYLVRVPLYLGTEVSRNSSPYFDPVRACLQEFLYDA